MPQLLPWRPWDVLLARCALQHLLRLPFQTTTLSQPLRSIHLSFARKASEVSTRATRRPRHQEPPRSTDVRAPGRGAEDKDAAKAGRGTLLKNLSAKRVNKTVGSKDCKSREESWKQKAPSSLGMQHRRAGSSASREESSI